jgi:peptidoglycan/xylan/chitin deacetylase (PgdA/CDA1 family)
MLHACGGCRGEVPILTWHAVGPGSGSYDVTPAAFARQLDAIRAAGFHTVSLHEVLARQDSGAHLPDKPVVLTFDDGAADGFTTVLPALRARGMKATFFLVPTWLGPDETHRHVEMDEGVARPCLTVQEARALDAAGMELGAHGLAHRRLAGLSEEGAREEIVGARRLLEQLLGIPIDLFAYPYNSLRRPHRALVREAGYRAAVAGVEHGSRDRFSLYRAPVVRSTTPEELVATLSKWR